ncbi:hypothetical protein OAQ86_06915 [Candidatus Pseudothioglobus singularis]|nr:hypothetical protein [Candidatus Pseudothioglobus singularis]
MNLILLELNEINFDIVQKYIDTGYDLPGFDSLIGGHLINTVAEDQYKEIEPWIQWPSVHTGLDFDGHKVFRLGDFINSNKKQFFEKVEEAGYTVGAISPMNASNKLKNPTFFIPDPWTQTASDGSLLSSMLSSALSQAVNDNSQSRITFTSLLKLSISFIALVKPLRYTSLVWYAITSLKKPWRKALFLDIFLFEVFKTLLSRKKPNFSTIFLNAGAHIQHHYFYNSPHVENNKLKNPSWYLAKSEDPFLEMIIVYDKIIEKLLNYSDTEIIIATGLSQKPYNHLNFYYRLVNHSSFLDDLGVSYLSVNPRMTRDFLINFKTPEDALYAEKKLSKVFVNNNVKLFNEIENRGDSLFVVLTYSDEITQKTTIYLEDWSSLLKQYVTFVAIKNGEHQSKGFAYFSEGLIKFAPPNNSQVAKIHNTVLNFFEVPN